MSLVVAFEEFDVAIDPTGGAYDRGQCRLLALKILAEAVKEGDLKFLLGRRAEAFAGGCGLRIEDFIKVAEENHETYYR